MKTIFSKVPKHTLFTSIFPLLFSIVFVLLIWQITQVSFKPPGYFTFSLDKAALYVDADGYCKDSVPDGLPSEEVVPETVQQALSKCVKILKEKGKSNSRPIKLPHVWHKDMEEHPEIKSGKLLYRFEMELGAPVTDLWAIALPAVSQNTAVFLNGTLLGWGGSFERPVVRNATRPQIFTIPVGMLKYVNNDKQDKVNKQEKNNNLGINEFDIYVISQPAKKGFLEKVYVAPIEILKSKFNNYHTFRYTLSWMISLTVIVISLFMFILWNYRRQDTEYGLFALGGLFWVIHTLNQFVVDIPFSSKVWEGLIYSSAGLLALTSVFFIHRLLDKKHPKHEKSLLIGVFVLSVLMLVLPTNSWLYLAVFSIGSLISVIIAFYVFFITVVYALKVKKIEWYALALSLGVIAEFGVYDLMIILDLRPIYKGQLLHFGAPFILFSFAWILLQRFVETIKKAEKYNHDLKLLNQTLENRVEDRGNKIKESYETIRLLGQEQVLLQERSRIMRDMHDGIGVYLTSMLRHLKNDTVDKEQLGEAAHSALNDLRLMIDSLGSASTDLPAMLGMFRTRISVALKSCNVELKWHVEELPAVTDFGPERALNLLRILQEAVTNALKHSDADSILLSACSEPFDSNSCLIKIKIIDNGQGFNADSANGNGLKNMRYRAKKINAELKINNSEKGTSVTIVLPLSTSCERDK